jgi:8-amino-7-oxononanoate synthase
MAALEILQSEPERRQRLWALSDQLRQGLMERGIEPYPGSTGPIVPVVLGSPAAAVAAAAQLKDRGYLVGAIRPPTVPQGTARLRISVSAVHREEDVSGLVTAIAEVVGRR